MINLQSLTPAHYHQSSFLTVHSYTPSLRDSFATSASPLSVNCALYLPPASKEPSADPARQPKTIRICFAHLPLATKVAKAPAGSTNHPTAPGQSLVLSCRMPSWEEILAKGGVQHQDDLFVGGDGKAGVFCEILGGSRPGVKGETILERVHFGDVVFPGVGVGREQEEIPLVGGWEDNSNGTAYDHLRQESSTSKRAASPGASPKLRRKTSSLSIGEMRNLNGGNQDAGFFQPRFEENRSEAGETHGSANSANSPDPPTPNELSTPDDSSSFLPTNNNAYPQPAIYNSNGAQHPAEGFSESPTFQTTFDPTSLGISYQPPPNAEASSSRPIKPLKKPSKASLRAQNQTLQPTSKSSSARSTPPAASIPNSNSTSGTATPSGSTSAGTRLSLAIGGELQSMAVGWSHPEWDRRRRLVQFWRRQNGTQIETSFMAIRPEDYIDGSIVISCIFREEYNECFVTSVDAIFLLEALLGTRFTIEEKNRIRRNLEASKPDTISKTRPETENFFRLIMSFPKPKPRNIEKDVKVFRWKDLEAAMMKSISKYHYPDTVAPGTVPVPIREPAKVTQTSADFIVAAQAIISKPADNRSPVPKRDSGSPGSNAHSRTTSHLPPPLIGSRSPPPLTQQQPFDYQPNQHNQYPYQHQQQQYEYPQPQQYITPLQPDESNAWMQHQPIASSSHDPYNQQQYQPLSYNNPPHLQTHIDPSLSSNEFDPSSSMFDAGDSGPDGQVTFDVYLQTGHGDGSVVEEGE